MILTWSLTMAGFIIIFVEIGGWSGEQNPHAILGTVTTFLCFIQPFGALFRPSPTHKNRPIFNWLHWLVGNLAHILASRLILLFLIFYCNFTNLFSLPVVTIFFAVQLTKAQLPDWMDWILVAFVGFHVFMHIVLSVRISLFIWGGIRERIGAETSLINVLNGSNDFYIKCVLLT